MTMSNTQSRAGFTLIDMIVTITVMSIVMAMAVPSLVNLSDGMKLGQGQRDVEVELNTARTIAVSSESPSDATIAANTTIVRAPPTSA